ncbi:hypothetical protein NQ318_015116 [Aromia moschata]|uniref:Uncharacterized protein n=1 Tax=Aromia moschata TaxID=1265417 RepID=A0AAV8YWC8_9CUCU|nr:hypothetical protein NQ318_015116 [Aromia moschata]
MYWDCGLGTMFMKSESNSFIRFSSNSPTESSVFIIPKKAYCALYNVHFRVALLVFQTKMTKVCRLCLQKLQRGSKYFNINAVESFTGFMPYRDQLTTCIPEMALDLIPNPVICNSCRSALKSAYDFKSRCLLVEKKIREYVESQPSDSVNYDLSQIPVTDLPPLVKAPSKEAPEKEVAPPIAGSDSELLLQLQKEVILPATGEIEITNIRTSVTRGAGKRKYPVESKDGTHTCGRCGMRFTDVGKLLLHKAVHGDDFVCNFCNRTFKSLQYLRKHNNMCSKIKNETEVNPILTKRPHLPTKAKNHLKRWLFRHTDHPYPHRPREADPHAGDQPVAAPDDVGDDMLELHTEVDLDDLSQRSSPTARELSPQPGTESAASVSMKAEAEANLEPVFAQVDIVAIKKELTDDRITIRVQNLSLFCDLKQ